MTTKLYCVRPSNDNDEYEVAVLETLEDTIVVPVPAEGDCPLLLLKDGTVGYNALRTIYPLTLAPVDGNVAEVHDKSI